MPQSDTINKSANDSSVRPASVDNNSNSVERKNGLIAANSSNTTEDIIQALPAAVYTCDANGYILTYNKAAVDLWGREPETGKDVWCGSWKAYEQDGTPLLPDQCPMAITLKKGKDVHDHEIIIESPDGVKRNVMSHPKLLYNAAGKVTGAINTLIDITEFKNIEERNGHFKAIVHSSDDAIISKTLDGIITSWNNGAERLFGYTAKEVIGEPITRIIPPDRLNEEPRILERLKRGERIDHFETKRITKNGRLLDISLSISPIKNSKGVITGASKIARDITAQKRAEQQLRESEQRTRDSEERLRLATEAANIGLWDIDIPTGITLSTPENRKIMGYSETEQWNLERFMQIVHPADFHRVNQALEQGLKSGSISYEARIVRSDNTERWIRVNGTIIFDKNHTPIRMLGTVLDITDQKKAKEELEKMVLARTSELQTTNSALEKSNHELEQFAYIASHDLQEPLRKIQTFADMVKEHLHDSKLTERYFEKINASAKRMSKLINDVLNYSRLTKTGEQFLRADLNKVLKDVLSDYELLIEQKQATITFTDLPTIKGIPLQLHQLFANLISNSLKFAETKPHITINSKILSPEEAHAYEQLKEGVTYVQLVFKDNGIGFEQQYAEQIFIIFQRLNNQRAYSGTGIGLALCKKIVDHHDGIITAHSELGKGATFTAILPVSH